MPPPSPTSANGNSSAETAWHVLSATRILALLGAHPKQGLSGHEAAERLRQEGLNELKAARRVSPWKLLLEQFKNVLIIVLLIAVVLSAVLGHVVEAVAIAIILLFAVILGFIQEYRAERAMEALRSMAAPTATVLRDGEEREIPAREVVPGDIVLLVTGDRIPADGRVVESVNLHADEAVLTGESVPVAKVEAEIRNERAPIGDRHNMVYGGTIVTYGRGKIVVTATGMRTEFGRIAGLLESVEEGPTPLQQNLDQVGRKLAKGALGIVAVVAALGVLRGQPLLEMFIFGIALAVAVVPEALPAVVTISLAIGVQRMARRHTLVRKLPAVETLGSTSVICSDKTGTLTRDEMTVRRILSAGESFEVTGAGYDPHGAFLREGNTPVTAPPHLLSLLRAAALASDTHLVKGKEWQIKGDPTEGALVVAAAKAGLQKDLLDVDFPRTAEIPFTSESKRMTTFHTTPEGGAVAFAKGAPEVILAACSRRRTPLGDEDLAPTAREEILEAAHGMADEALRVLAVAERQGATIDEVDHRMTFLGLLGMIDPPRPEALAAVRKCREAGIRVIMITGDHPITAQAVARELQILHGNRVVTGEQLAAMSDEELREVIDQIDVFARVSPAHKLRVVTALQQRGHIVAMTGDGVNDAPALKKADIGIAMGISGTDVSREAAEMTLTDDNFASIVAAVEEGRAIFGNIKKYLMYLLSSNIGELLLMASAGIFGFPLPLSAVQILYVNLATDGLPALALAVDPPEPDLMRRPPRHPKTGLFTRPVVFLMLLGGLWSTLVNLGLFSSLLVLGRPLPEAMTQTFLSLVLIQFFKAYAFRSDRHSVLRGVTKNRWLHLAIAWELGLLLLIVYLPALQKPFGTIPLSARDWVLIITLAASVIPVLEMGKWMIRRKHVR